MSISELIARHWALMIWLREGASQSVMDAWRAELAEIDRIIKEMAEQEALPF